MQNGVLRSPNRERPKVPFPRLPGVTFYRKMCRFFPIDRLPSSSEGKNFFRARNPKRKGKGLQNLIWWFNSIPRLHLPSIQSTKKARAPQPSRPEESWAFGPPKVMKNGSCSATTIPGSAALPFVISTGAPKERSGEICGFFGQYSPPLFSRCNVDHVQRRPTLSNPC